MEDNFWTFLFWFISGALTYNVLANLFSLSKALFILREAMYWSLRSLSTTHDGYIITQKLKYEKLRENDVTEEEIEAMKKIDLISLEQWKTLAISNLLINCPRKYRESMGFHDWNSAMKTIKK